MHRSRLVPIPALALGLACLVAPSARAQLTEVQPGARVRVVAPGIVAGRYVGTVLQRMPDTLRLGSTDAQPIDVAISRITELDVSRGTSRLAGAGVGVLWGLPIGLALGAVTTGASGATNDGEYILANGIGGAFWGALIGAIAGREQWEPFDLSSRRGASLRMTRDGVRVAVSF